MPLGSPFGDIARRVECAVFLEFFGNTPELLAAEFEPYEATSTFLLVVDRELERAAGAVRILPGGGKTLVDVEKHLQLSPEAAIARHTLSLDRCWDVATLAVLKPYRRTGISLALYARLHAATVAAGIQHGLAILDEHAYQQLLGLGMCIEPLCESEPFSYLGSPKNRAVVIHVGPPQNLSFPAAHQTQHPTAMHAHGRQTP